MILIRTPLRLSIGGGGTDLPSYYSKFGSTFISAAINQYIYITCHHSKFDDKIRLRYSRMEEVDNVDKIQNEIIRETFKAHDIESRIELTSHAEIPSGTGLGSSGSFGVGILQALYPSQSKDWLAQEATRIQMDVLKHPIGIQDQYAAAYGGLNIYKVSKKGNVEIKPFKAGEKTAEILYKLESGLALFFTGFKREAKEILVIQRDKAEDKDMIKSLHHTQELCYDIRDALHRGKLQKFGEIMNDHWKYKKQRSPKMTNPQIDEWYELGLKNGAIGGKLVGAGGGGFLLFYTEEKERLIEAMPLQHIDFQFDFVGSKVLINQ